MWDRVLYRAKQLWFSLTSQMHEEDRLFAHQHLNQKEAALFFTLPEFEQKHAVVVARKMQKLAAGLKMIDQEKLVRLGLLHDVGKVGARLSIFDKSLLVILHRLTPSLYNYLAKQGGAEKPFFYVRKFYVHQHHGEVGAQLLRKIKEGADVIEEIQAHDKPYGEHDVYLKLLDLSDSTF